MSLNGTVLRGCFGVAVALMIAVGSSGAPAADRQVQPNNPAASRSERQAATTNPAGALTNPVVVAINCGAAVAYRGSAYTSYTSYANGPGTVFSADTYFSGGKAESISQPLMGLGFVDPSLYRSFRSGPCTYTIPVPNGTYTVILEYCEPAPTSVVGSRVFNVAIQGKTVLGDFDILANNRHPLTPVYMTSNARVTDGTLTIAQTDGKAGTPVISAIIVRKPPAVPTKIATGEYQLFYLVNGQLLGGGSNRAGEGGLPWPAVGNCPFPCRSIQAPGVTFIDAACGGYASMGLDNTGHVWMWGRNNYAEQGNGRIDDKFYVPTKILSDSDGKPFDDVKSIGSGFEFEAALKNDGTVWVWGAATREVGSAGIAGNGDASDQFILRPRKAPLPAGVSISQISVGIYQIMALDSTGAVWSWGGSTDLSIYDRGTMTRDAATPTKLAGALAGKKITAISCNAGAEYAIDSNKNLYCWGSIGNWMCQGSSTKSEPINYPVAMNYTKLRGLSGHVVKVVVSSYATHALLDDGTLWGWGSSIRGEVGDGNMDWAMGKLADPGAFRPNEYLVLEPVKVLTDVADVYASCEGGANFAVKTDGSIWSWGFNKTSYLGNGIDGGGVDVSHHADYFDQPSPMQVCPY
jgi:alpha-tubulin suppressor-like RCC1 family protein